ncbi:hypothetical protein EDD40_0307 [Saccharothrix texasensis]|uniref:Uncharacterized protein n=1 Tax=Saccharothrix texasensis TaxID=103734 RepID=A0A3N1GXN4_9PSEU|nr:hypothetical protein EDD40_0307 [Saccharothrix texasensis]
MEAGEAPDVLPEDVAEVKVGRLPGSAAKAT